MTRLLPALVLLACAAGLPAQFPAPLPKEERLPLLDGGFWQVGPGLSGQLTDERHAAEVAHMTELGMDIIIVQYIASQYDHDAGTYYAYVSGTNLPLHPALARKDPIGAIMEAAEEHGVRVILGGLLMPLPRHENYEENIAIWTSEETMDYRRAVIERFKDSPAFVGWYTPNEPNPANLYGAGADPQLMIDATAETIEVVLEAKPDLGIVKCIGLYLEPTNGALSPASEEYLDAFWRPWVEQLDAVDVWMVIDGVGTTLSNLEHTDMAQRWARELAHEHGKQYWTDVENAHMTAGDYRPMSMEELAASLEVAARHGERLITFDYAHYMSRESPKPDAVRLHEDYAAYRQELLGEGEARVEGAF